MRKRFQRTAEDKARDREAVQAFIESKVEMIRTDPNLTESEKEAAIDEIRSTTDEGTPEES